ncbi:uncharacterized protein VTP21DRAFT_2604 [Calcarisporiella thermophila]|uniref:uncharacterized protein n=1 Tax=Calcarisporiella thermophila TaxID=911321 RepID=UPI0037427706
MKKSTVLGRISSKSSDPPHGDDHPSVESPDGPDSLDRKQEHKRAWRPWHSTSKEHHSSSSQPLRLHHPNQQLQQQQQQQHPSPLHPHPQQRHLHEHSWPHGLTRLLLRQARSTEELVCNHSTPSSSPPPSSLLAPSAPPLL